MRRKNRKGKNTELANAAEIKCRTVIKSEELLDTVSSTVSEMQNGFFPSLIHDRNKLPSRRLAVESEVHEEEHRESLRDSLRSLG